MRLRTFTAPDMSRAMLMVREALGDEAVIISTARDSGGKAVSVTAALDEELLEANASAARSTHQAQDEWPDAPASGIASYLAANANAKARERAPAAKPTAQAAPAAVVGDRVQAYFLHELEQILNFHSVPHLLAERMLRTARQLEIPLEANERGVSHGLTELLSRLFRFRPLALDVPNCDERIMLVGPPGVGKTLVAAKIAAHRIADRHPLDVVSIDNKRAGGIEQLQAFTSIMGKDVAVASGRSELRQLLKEAHVGTPMVIDSFGTNPYSFAELKELTDFANLNGIEPVLVLAAGMDAQEAGDVVRAFSFLGGKRLLVTRLDSTRRLGAVLAAAEAGALAFCNMTVSAQVAGGLQYLNAGKLAQLLMQHKQDAQG